MTETSGVFPQKPASIPAKSMKAEILKKLAEGDFQKAKTAIAAYPARRVINCLIAFFCHREALMRWRAIETAGYVVAGHAESDPESARVIMRRFMWMLNDESGGIGWGVPETMGETLRLSDQLFAEYHRIFLSYVQPECNYLEHPVLQRGLLWGIGRMARSRPEVRAVLSDIAPFLASEDPYHRAYALLVFGYAGGPDAKGQTGRLRGDEAVVEIYGDGGFMETTVGEISRNGGLLKTS